MSDDARQEIERAKRGDFAAFARLVAPLEARLFRTALVLCGEREEARDLLQETWLAVYRSLPRFAGRASLVTYATGVLLNLNRRRLRRRACRKRLRPEDLRPPDERVPLLDEPGREAVRRALTGLDPRFQAVLVLKYVEELSVAEIAGELLVSEGTVKSRLYRGRACLRRRLAAAGFRVADPG